MTTERDQESPKQPNSVQKMKPRDRAELARLVRRYSRDVVVSAAQIIPEPRKRGRPSNSDDSQEAAEDIAEFIYTYAELHKKAGSKKPVEDAFLDLYELLAPEEKQKQPGHFEKWLSTQKRKRSSVRRRKEEELNAAKKSASKMAGVRKKGRRITPGK